MKNCRGQVCNDASKFLGNRNGVAAKFREEFPAALSVHCLAHRLNLVLQETTGKIKIMRSAFDFAMEVTYLTAFSPKMDTGNPKSFGIKHLCPTRWTVRRKAFYY